jgi:hypothetical protein
MEKRVLRLQTVLIIGTFVVALLMFFFTPQINALGIPAEGPFAVIGLALMVVGLLSLRYQVSVGRQRGASGPTYGRDAARTGLVLELIGLIFLLPLVIRLMNR